jgi:signal transduction histidine kinase
MMTKFFPGVLLCFFSVVALAQGDTQDIDWFRQFSPPDSLNAVDVEIKRYQKLVDQAAESNDLKGQSSALKMLAMLHLRGTGDYEKAIDALIKALSIEDKLALTREEVITYLALSLVFEQTGNLKRSHEMLERALTINHPIANNRVSAYIMAKQGKLQSLMGDLDDAAVSYNSGISALDTLVDESLKAEALYDLAGVLVRQNKLTAALDTYKKSLALFRAINDRRNEARTLSEIGTLYRTMKKDEKSLANYVVALEIAQQLKDKDLTAKVYNNVGALYLEQKNVERAAANVDLALAAAQSSQNQHEMKRSYELLSTSFKMVKDYEKALRYRDLYVELEEFMQRDINQQKLLDAEMNYQIEKKENQIDQLNTIREAKERELAAERRIKVVLYAAFGLAFVVMVLILYLYFLKRKTNKVLQAANETVRSQNVQLTELNATKDKFFSIISHDLKGPLNSLTSFSGLLINHTDSLSKDEIKMLAKDLDKSLKNLFALLENLLEWSRSQTGNIEFRPEPFDLSALLEQNRELLKGQAANKKITLETISKPGIIVNAHKNSINTVVRNLVSNAIKFTPEGGKVSMIAQTEGTQLIVSIKDTGVGMSKDVIAKLFRIDTKHTTKGTADEKGTGLGLILCKDFVEKNGGRIWVTSEPGKGSTFSFQIAYQTIQAATSVVA